MSDGARNPWMSLQLWNENTSEGKNTHGEKAGSIQDRRGGRDLFLFEKQLTARNQRSRPS
jgi:hypothetical protein